MPTPKHNPKVDAYAKKAEDFAKPVFAHLRALIHATCPEVVEDVKWGIPHFDCKGDMMCIFAAYKKHCSFTFYKDELMGDARLKANAGVPAAKRFMGKLTDVADLPSDRELKFWIKESKTTSKVLARMPEDSDYRPDPKSRTAREIAWQIVGEEKMIIDALETGTVAWKPGPPPATMKELCETYDRQSAEIVRRWQALPAERWEGALDFFGSQRPASPMAWSFLFDIVHHRGQITTYLRPMGSTVPQVYGPSADEP